MQKQSSNNQSQLQDSQIQLQQKKYILNIIFPKKFNDNYQKLASNLKQLYQHDQHYQELINHTFRNHYYTQAQVYTEFFKEKYPQNKEPKISEYYQNHIFPGLKTLGQFRKYPEKYPYRILHPLKENLFLQLDNIFEQYGYIPNLQRFLTFFPQFLLKMRIVEQQLFQHSKLDQQTTYFLAVCSSMQNGCPYMINRTVIKFLSKGGKIQWIKQKKYSIKISKVLQLNRILARRVWEITSNDIEEIVQEGHWNINQIALIIQIFSFVHSLCVITLGLGLKPEQRSQQFSTESIEKHLKQYQQAKIQSLHQNKPLKQTLPLLMALLQNTKISSFQGMTQKKVTNPTKKSFSQSNQQETKNQCISIPIQIQPYMRQIGIQLTEQKLVIQVMKQINLLPEFQPIQKRRDNKFNQYTCIDFNFQLKTLPRLLSITTITESIKKLSALIKQGQQMSLQNFGEQTILSTKQLRKAQRYYGQNLCGFSHPEYDYRKYMTDILTIPLRFYIRILMLSPLHMKKQIIDEINHQKGQVELFDLGHTAILIAMAKLKLCLTLSTYYFDY